MSTDEFMECSSDFARIQIKRRKLEYAQKQLSLDPDAPAANRYERQVSELAERVDVLKVYFAGKHRKLVEDSERWNSTGAWMMFDAERRAAVDDILANYHPTPEEFAAAKMVAPPLRNTDDTAETLRSKLQGTIQAISTTLFMAIAQWGQLIWLPSIVTGLLFGRGLLMNTFGVVLVNSRGDRAGRSRVFVRMLLPVVPVFLLMMLDEKLTYVGRSSLNLFSDFTSSTTFFLYLLLYLGLALGLPLLSILSGRFTVDRIARCYIVPA